MISYAQNLEDVLLARAFKGQQAGFYIDVGAWDPEKDSVTKHFYDKGWRGVNIEPAREFYDALCLGRERDINLHIALGKSRGERLFYKFGGEGISTPDKQLAVSFARKGFRYEESGITVETLAAICEEYTPGTIDFIKIDVEGMENEVIRGADWNRYRPRILVIEAVDLLFHAPQWEAWEPFLLENGYSFVYFDGINRFYIRNEEPELAKYFATPPGVLDEFQTSEHVFLKNANNALRKKHSELERQHIALEEQYIDLQRQRDNLQSELAELRQEVANTIHYAHQVEAQLHTVASSRSFRIGYAIRRFARPFLPVLRPGMRLARKAKRAVLRINHWLTSVPRPQRKTVIANRYRQALAPGQAYSFTATASSPPQHGGNGPLKQVRKAMEADLAGNGSEALAAALDATGHDEEELLLRGGLAPRARNAVVQARLYQRLTAAAPGNKEAFEKYKPAPPGGTEIVVDVRCLQDPDYRERGVGRHAGHVLRVLAEACQGKKDLALLVDAALPDLAPEFAALGKRCAASFDARAVDDVALFVELSPMTASPGPALAFLLDPRVKSMAVLYDFIPGDFADHYLSTDEQWISYATQTAALSRYDAFLAISESTAAELKQKIGQDVSVKVTGVANPLERLESGAGPNEPTGTKFNKYVLAASGGDARKNLLAAIAAVADCTKIRRRKLGLVVTGAYPAEMIRVAEDFAIKCGLSLKRIQFCSKLTDSQLKNLYSGAEVVLVPSFAEGFSIPVIEAVATGTPVLASDIAVHRELMGEGWWYSAPEDDPLALSANLTRALSNLAGLYKQQQAAIGGRFADEAVSERLREAFAGRITGSARAGSAKTKKPVPLRPAGRRPRLAVITPLPPQQSGVADYSAFTLDTVAKFADVVIFTDKRIKSVANNSIEVRPYSVEPYLDPNFDAVISVLGNSHFHIPVMEYFLEFGGACIAHDPRMTEFYNFWLGTEAFAAMLSRYTNEPVVPEDLLALMFSPDGLPSLAYGEIALRARPLLVHAQGIARNIFKETGVEPAVLPYIPHHLPPVDTIGSETFYSTRKKLGFDKTLHVVTFGILHDHYKANGVLLDAIAWLRQWGIICHIHYVGSASAPEKEMLLQRAAKLGVTSAVHLSGWVSQSKMYEYLLGADAAVQLRTFTHAPISGALLDCMAFGVPCVATGNLALEMQSPSFVRPLPAHFSGLILAEQLATVLESRRQDSLDVIESERKEWLSRRTADIYARRLLMALGLEVSLS